jgi:amino acid transporter
MALAAMITNAALLNSTVLATTRMPFAMAEDGFLPKILTTLHPRFATPAVSIVISGLICAALSIFSLTQLIAVYAWLRVATSVMTVLSAWKLRRALPQIPRPFLIPGGRAGLAYAVIAPILLAAIAVVGSVGANVQAGNRLVLFAAPAMIFLGPLVYFLWRNVRRMQ